jgi:hypothetical protein
LSDTEADELGYQLRNSLPSVASAKNLKSQSNPDATRAISLKDLQEVKTQSLLKKRLETIVKRKEAVKKPATKKKAKVAPQVTPAQVLSVLIVAGSLYYSFFFRKPVEDIPHVPPATKAQPIVKAVEKVPETKSGVKIPTLVSEAEISPKDSFQVLLKDNKCTLEIEKYFCDKLGTLAVQPWGVALVGTSIDIFLDGGPFLSDARTILGSRLGFVSPTTPDEKTKFEKDIQRLGIALFLLKNLPQDLDYLKLKDYKINFVFFTKNSTTTEAVPFVIATFVPASLQELLILMPKTLPEDVKKVGPDALEFSAPFYRMY